MLLWFIKERFLWYQIQISMGRSCKDVRPFSTLQRPLCSIPHCTGHADRIATKAYVWSLSVTFAWMPLTHACAGAHALKCNSVIFNASSCSLYPICTAVLPPKAGCCTPPSPPQTHAHTHTYTHRHISITSMGRPFPLPPPPMCTQLAAHSATPSSLPDNTTARHPIIFMHTLHTHSYTAVRAVLFVGRDAWAMWACSCTTVMFLPDICIQTAEAGSPQLQGSNKADQGVRKRWWVTFLSLNDLGRGMGGGTCSWSLDSPWGSPVRMRPIIHPNGKNQWTKWDHLRVVSQSLLLSPTLTEGKQLISTYMSCWSFNKHLFRLCNLATVNQCGTISEW